MKLLKLQKMSEWNEFSSIAGKWKFCRIYWQWILIEQTSLYTVVYRTFLYNPTNLKVPKKAPCTFKKSNLVADVFARPLGQHCCSFIGRQLKSIHFTPVKAKTRAMSPTWRTWCNSGPPNLTLTSHLLAFDQSISAHGPGMNCWRRYTATTGLKLLAKGAFLEGHIL